MSSTDVRKLPSTTQETPESKESKLPSPPPSPRLPTIRPLRITRSSQDLGDRRTGSVNITESVFSISVTAHPEWSSFVFSKSILSILEAHGAQPEIMSSTPTHTCLAFEDSKFRGKIEPLADELDQYGDVCSIYSHFPSLHMFLTLFIYLRRSLSSMAWRCLQC